MKTWRRPWRKPGLIYQFSSDSDRVQSLGRIKDPGGRSTLFTDSFRSIADRAFNVKILKIREVLSAEFGGKGDD